MRIALVYDALVPWIDGGAERRYHELGRRLAVAHEVTHVSWQWWDGPARMERDGIRHVGVGRPRELYGTDGKRTVREAVSFAARVGPALLRGRWDVVDCSATPYLPLYAAWAATRLTRTPLVATWHEFWGTHWATYLPHRPGVARVARGLESQARRLGDRIVAVSPFTLDRLGPVVAARGCVVANGVPLTPPARALRGARSVDVAYVGRLIDEKRLEMLIEAVAALRDAGRRVSAVIAGDGPMRATLEAQAVTRGVADRVRFAGRISDDERAALLGDARIFVLPSMREGFGISVIEAFAAGAVPVVVRGPHTAAWQLLEDGVDGRVCEPTPVSIASAMASLLDDAPRLAAMRTAGIRGARRFDWDALAGEMERVYADAARRGPALVGAT